MKHTQRIFAFILCLVLALCTVLPIAASDETAEEPEALEWIVSEDQTTLSYGDQTYTRYAIPSYDWFRPYNFYDFMQDASTDGWILCVGQPILSMEGEEIVFYEDMVVLYDYVNVNTEFLVYVTAQGALALDEYIAGNYAQYELTSGSYEGTTISEQTVRNWHEAAATETVDATLLEDLVSYNVLGYDSTLTFAHILGQVFEYNGDYLYVNYDALDNSYFDANGALSFRSGSVPVVRLNAEDKAQVTDAVGRFEYYSANIVSAPTEPLDATLSMVLFLLLASPLLYLLPILFLALGIVMRCIKKIPNNKRWNIVIIVALVWLGLSLLASCILVIPTIFL